MTRAYVTADSLPPIAGRFSSGKSDTSEHKPVAAWWKKGGHDAVLPSSVLPEVACLLQTRIGSDAEEAFSRAIVDGELIVESLEDADLPRIADVMRKYRDFPLGFVDASIVVLAERLETRDVLTTDRRHFSVVRPRHPRTLTLLP